MKQFKSSIEPQFTAILNVLLKKIGYSFSSQSVSTYMNNHPNKGTMLSLTDFLTSNGIESAAAKIDYNDLININLGVVAYLNDGKLVVIHELDDNGVVFLDDKSKKEYISKDDFLLNWDGIVVLATPKPLNLFANFKANIKPEFSITNLIAAIFLILIIGLITTNYQFLTIEINVFALVVEKLVGVMLSILLLQQTFGGQSAIGNKICGLTKNDSETETGCSKLLSSENGRLTSWVSWAELGFIYFLSTTIYLLYSGIQISEFLSILAFISILSLPFTVFSLGFQLKTKTYCVLCLMVVCSLWIEVLLTWKYFDYHSIALKSFYLLGYIGIIVTLLWFLFRKIYHGYSLLNLVNLRFNKFKFDLKVFEALSSSGKLAEVESTDPVMTFGNELAKLELLIISNPYCQPCSYAHQVLEELLHKYPQHFKLKIIMPYTERDNDNRKEVVENFLNSYLLEEKYITQEKIGSWFRLKVKSTLNLDSIEIRRNEIFEGYAKYYKSYMERTGIFYTPAIFINGHLLPSQYDIEDIESLILLLS